MSNENLSGETEPQWSDFEKKDDEETAEVEEKEGKTSWNQLSIPTRAEALDNEIIIPDTIVHDEYECITGTKKKEKKNKKNEDGVFFRKNEKYSYFAAIDGIGSVDGYEATQEIMRLMGKKLKNNKGKELENLLAKINKKLYENKNNKLSSCISAAQYNQETNELKIINAGDTRGIVLNSEGEIKYLTEIQIHLNDIIKSLIDNESEKAEKIKEIIYQRGFENTEEIRTFSKELINELLKEIYIDRRSAFAITSYLGNAPENNNFDINSIDIEQKDYLALVTDGISSHDTLSETEVVETIINAENLKTAMKSLIGKGKERKSYDDTSGIVTKFK